MMLTFPRAILLACLSSRVATQSFLEECPIPDNPVILTWSDVPTPVPPKYSGGIVFTTELDVPTEPPIPAPTEPPVEPPTEPPVVAPTEPEEDCIPDIKYTPSGSTEFQYPPIEVIKQDGSTVTFSFAQTYKDGAICVLALDYDSADQNTRVCDPHEGALGGPIGIYKAKCVNNMVTIDVYANDEIFNGESFTGVPGRCSPVKDGANTHAYKIEIPCMYDPITCPPEEDPTCDGSEDMVLLHENFQTSDQIHGWIFGELKGGYLLTSPEGVISKTIKAPKDSYSLLVEFKITEFEPSSSLTVMIGEYDIGPITLSSTKNDAPIDKYAGDIKVEVKPNTPTSNSIKLNIPAAWYDGTGRFTFAIGNANVGIDLLTITSICSEPVVIPTDSPTVRPTPAPTKGPTANPSISPTPRPTTKPTFAPTLSPTATPSSSPSTEKPILVTAAPTADCIPNIKYQSTTAVDFVYPPIQIIKQEVNTVTFSVSQTWSEDTICQVATDYDSVSGTKVCDPKSSVGPGEFGIYKAKCINGVATISLYAKDDMFGDASTTVPGRCSPLTGGKATIGHTVTIPCQVEHEDCPLPDAPVCDGSEDMLVASETFQNGEAETWLFGKSASKPGFGTYLAPPTPEVSKTFLVPTAASAIVIEFKIYELEASSSSSIRLQDYDIDLGKFGIGSADSNKGYAGDIYVETIGTSANTNTAKLIVPKDWFAPSGRLTVGFHNSNVGIDDFKITSICSEPVCVAKAQIISNTASSPLYPPIDILKLQGETVTFSVSQTWTDGTICQVATDYVSATTNSQVCDPKAGVPPGEFGIYKAKCVNGFATISLYAKDDIFKGSSATVPGRCTPLTGGASTIGHTIKIPCSRSIACPPVIEPKCQSAGDMVISNETFEKGEAATWLFGVDATTSGLTKYLAPDEADMAKTFTVPLQASSVKVNFKMYELQDSRKLYISMGDYIIDLGHFSTLTDDTKQGYSGDIMVTTTAKSKTMNEVALVVPAQWYTPTGRLTISFHNSKGVGIDDLSVVAVCGAST